MLVSAHDGAPGATAPPAARLASFLRRRPIACVHGQHLSGPNFVWHTGASRRRRGSPGRYLRRPLAVVGARGPFKKPSTNQHLHGHPPTPPPLHVRSHVPISARRYVRTYAYIICTHGPHEFDFQSILCLCMCLCTGLPAPRTTQALGACGRAGPGGSCGKIALKPRPPS